MGTWIGSQRSSSNIWSYNLKMPE